MSDNLLKKISSLINSAFVIEDLNNFCFFHFREVYDQFQRHDQKITRLRKLLEYVERQNLVDNLLLSVIEEVPSRKTEIEALRRELGLAVSAPAAAQRSPQIIINHRAAIQHFDQLLTPDSVYQVLWLTGQPKMGKTHLLKKIFPIRAQQQRRLWAGLELRGQASIFDTLQRLRSQLVPGVTFTNFDRAYQELHRQVFLEGKKTGTIEEFLSQQSRREEGKQRHDLQLTKHFVADLVANAGTSLILLFDTLDDLEAAVPAWLLQTFLVQLDPLKHIRVVIGGRTPPPSVETYNFLYYVHPLAPVTDHQEYVSYCDRLGLLLSVEEIVEYIQLTEHTPGLFVELVQNTQQAEVGYVH